jgi:hypothetical protein
MAPGLPRPLTARGFSMGLVAEGDIAGLCQLWLLLSQVALTCCPNVPDILSFLAAILLTASAWHVKWQLVPGGKKRRPLWLLLQTAKSRKHQEKLFPEFVAAALAQVPFFRFPLLSNLPSWKPFLVFWWFGVSLWLLPSMHPGI